MIIGIPSEHISRETRVAVIPETAIRLAGLNGAELLVERKIGALCGYCGFDDGDYLESKAGFADTTAEILSRADVVLRVQPSPPEQAETLKPGAVHISYLDPFRDRKLVELYAERGITAISMDMIPRIARAQKMDALSSQASLAGYSAVILASSRLNRIFPMMTTAAGTINPPRVFIIGAGVAGLQAIATAKRLGALVYAFDTRPVVEEQVKSVGARFVKIDLGETGERKSGYAFELTGEQLEKQRKLMADHCAKSDVVITTARVFGKSAPLLITREIVERMKPGSLIIDLSIDSGGNVAVSEMDREVVISGVKVLAPSMIERTVPVHASQMYANNVAAMVEEFWDGEAGAFRLNTEDEIIRNSLITHNGKIVHPWTGEGDT